MVWFEKRSLEQKREPGARQAESSREGDERSESSSACAPSHTMTRTACRAFYRTLQTPWGTEWFAWAVAVDMVLPDRAMRGTESQDYTSSNPISHSLPHWDINTAAKLLVRVYTHTPTHQKAWNTILVSCICQHPERSRLSQIRSWGVNFICVPNTILNMVVFSPEASNDLTLSLVRSCAELGLFGFSGLILVRDMILRPIWKLGWSSQISWKWD